MKHHSLLKPEHSKQLFFDLIKTNTPIPSALLLCDLVNVMDSYDSRNAKEIALLCNLPHTTALYNLRKLEKNGYVLQVKKKNRKAWQICKHAEELVDSNEEIEEDIFFDAILANMGVKTAAFFKKAIIYLERDKEISAKELAAKIGYAHTGVLKHLKRLSLKDYVIRTGHRTWKLGKISLKFK